MIIKTQKNSQNGAAFWIARVGQCGKPMKVNNYREGNTYAVFSEDPERDFQTVKLCYDLGLFRLYSLGSCQEAIRIGDVRKVIDSAPTLGSDEANKLTMVERSITAMMNKVDELKQLQKQLQQSIYHHARA